MSRICVVEVLGNSEGGGANFVMGLIESLDPEQFAVTLIAPDSDMLAERCGLAGATFTPLQLMQSRSSRMIQKRLARLLSQAQADIIHAHGTRAAWYTSRCLARDARKPSFFYSEHLFSFDARRGLSRLPWYAIEYSLCRRADTVLTSTPLNARRLLSRGWLTPERIGCDRVGFPAEKVRKEVEQPLPRAAFAAAEDAPLVGSVGRLTPQKGWPYLLQAFASVLEQAPTSCLVIVGDGEERHSLNAQSQSLGISEHVHFVGAQSNPWSWLAQCDVIALPSLWEGGWQTPLEALAARLPLVVTRVGGVEEYVVEGETGFVVPPRDTPALAEALLTLLRDPSRRSAMRAAPRDILDDFDVAHVQRIIAALYVRVARERQQGDRDGAIPGRIGARVTPNLLNQEEYPL